MGGLATGFALVVLGLAMSTYVPAAAGSRWSAAVRDYADVEDPRPYIDEVLPDEFPLSMFYTQLKAKIAPAMDARPARTPVAA